MNEANSLNLGGRAALSVPLIAIVAALFLAAFEWAFRTENSMFDGPAVFNSSLEWNLRFGNPHAHPEQDVRISLMCTRMSLLFPPPA